MRPWTDDAPRPFRFPNWRAVGLAAVLFATAACSGGGGCGGCSAFKQQAFPKKHYDKTIETSGQARVTKKGLDFLESEVSNLITQFRPQGLDFCVPKSSSGDATFCYKKQCKGGSQTGCKLDLKLKNAKITPQSPDTLLVEMTIGQLVEKLPFKYDTFAGDITCHLDLHKDGAADDVPASVGADLPVRFAIDKQSTLNNTTIKVDQTTVDLSDLAIDIDGGVDCSVVDAAVSAFFEGELRKRLKNQLTGSIRSRLAQQFCKTCASQGASCPSNASCGTKSGVDVCKWDANGTCVSSPLGTEGRLQLGSTIGDIVEPPSARVSMMLRATDHAKVDTGLSLGLRTGFQQVETRECAPVDPSSRPNFDPVQPSSKIFTDKQPNNGDSFMVGLGLHERTVEQMLWSTWASGATCLRVGSSFNEMLSTDALRLFLPSIEKLAPSNQPLYLRVSPQKPPKVTLGDNKIQKSGDSYTLQDPLMTIDWKDLDLHFYAFVQDRFTRLYTTRVDLEIPIGLEPNGKGQVVPVTGDLEKAPRNIRVRNYRILAESEQKLKSVVPMLLGQALPQLTGSLAQPIDLPTFSGYQLVVEKGDITSVDDNKFIALYTNLKYVGNTQPLVAELQPSVRKLRVRTPDGVSGERIPEPTVEVDLRARRLGGGSIPSQTDVEYSYRVDNGFWSMFHRTESLEIDSPALSMEGEHRIQIRARYAGEPGTASRPIEKTVRVDYQPPEVELDRQDEIVAFEATDVVDSADQLDYRYRAVGREGEVLREWTEWGETREVDLMDLHTEHPVELTVEARDRSGHVGSSTETFPTTPSLVGTAPEGASQEADGRGGCSVGSSERPPIGWLWMFALGALGLIARRRRRLAALVGVLAVSALLATGCDDGITAGEECNPSCKSWQTCNNGTCVGESCKSNSDCSCSNGQPGICLQGNCSCKNFCSNGCGEDKYCCFKKDSCKSFPNPCAGKSCKPGYKTKVTSKGQPNRKKCKVQGAKCECVEKEPLPHGWYGASASIDSTLGRTAVSAYNRTYGDLMVGTVDGDLSVDWHYVDGVPEDGKIVAGPSGPRGGVEDDGVDVGRHSSVAVDSSGRIHVFYRDNDDENLKYTRGTPGSEGYDFSTTTLRDEEETGLYTSAAVKDGVVHAVYGSLAEEITVDGVKVDGSRLFHVSFPVDASLGQLSPKPEQLHAAADRNPCGACGSGKRCVLSSNSCETITNDCSEGCSSGNSCVSGTCKSIYLPAETAPHRLMTGLYSEILPRKNELVVLFYDHVNRRIGWVTGTSGNWDSPGFLKKPSGPYAGAALDSSGKLHIAYIDPTDQALVYRRPDGSKPETIVGGVRDTSSEHLKSAIGEDVDLWIDSNGKAHVTYQDPTLHRLYRADRTGANSWKQTVLSSTGSEGSYQGARGFYSANAAPELGLVVEMVINQQVDPVRANLQFKRLK